MKQLILLSVMLTCVEIGLSQPKITEDKKEIQKIMKTFMDCLIKKDSTLFYSLFHSEPIVWVGVFRDKTQESRLKNDNTKKNYFSSTYQRFYRSISNAGADEEKFYNIDIHEDGSIASVTFDYSFWENKRKVNWGKESWALVKAAGLWKITSVIFSLEFEDVKS